MTTKLNGVRAALLGLFFFAAGAQAAPHFSEVIVSDSNNGNATERFAPDTPKIYVRAGLVGVARGSKVRSDWFAEDTEDAAPPNHKIDSVTLDTGTLTDVATFSLSKPSTGWPIGKYRVDLYINDKPAGNVHFKVTKEPDSD